MVTLEYLRLFIAYARTLIGLKYRRTSTVSCHNASRANKRNTKWRRLSGCFNLFPYHHTFGRICSVTSLRDCLYLRGTLWYFLLWIGFPRGLILVFFPLHHLAYKVALLFLDMVCKLHGFLRSLVSDRDPIFVNSFWRELFHLNGTTGKSVFYVG